MQNITKQNSILVVVSLLLLIIPFFWLKPGEIDIGGDSSRLYFYDPISYLKSFSLFGVSPQGLGIVEPNYYFIPFILLLTVLKQILGSSYLLITIFNGLKLVIGFLSIYFIVKELLSSEKNRNNILNFAAIVAGLFYIFSGKITDTWDKAILSHNQVFLNPLMFYLILRFIVTMKFKYVWWALFVSVIFAPNFGYTSAPPFFSFYPLAILFIIFYAVFLRKAKIIWHKVFITITAFFLLQAFHLVPQIISLFDTGSITNTRVFDKASIAHEGVRYFLGVLPLAKASINLLLPSPIDLFKAFSVLVPISMLIGLLLARKNKTILLTTLFFLLTYFLLTANLTNAGILLYQQLFYLPGFSMFRNFIGQWSFIYTFFYALLFGQAIFFILEKISKRKAEVIISLLILTILLSAWNFINGQLVNKIHNSTNETRIAIQMDPKYEIFLQYIKDIPSGGKILTLPFTDAYYQVLAGKDGGAYVGLSTISYLTDKKDFFGYQVLTETFSEKLLKYARENDYESIKQMLISLNIRYIFHNDDRRIYETSFPGPYQYVSQSLPSTQNDYKKFIAKLGFKKKYSISTYSLYEIDISEYLPQFHIAKTIAVNDPKPNTKESTINNISDIRTLYVNANTCTKFENEKLCTKNENKLPKITYTRINPTKYYIEISDATAPYTLVFLESFHNNWKLFLKDGANENNKVISHYFDGEVRETNHKNIFMNEEIFETNSKKSIADNSHFMAHGYANAWLIKPTDINKNNYTLIAEMTSQKTFLYSLAVSLIAFFILIFGGIIFFLKKYTDIIKK